jgi:hypothetical protein
MYGRIGALVSHSRHDPRKTTAAARRAFIESFEKLADPEGVLPPAERRRRGEMLRRAHYTRIALKAHLARQARAKAKRQKVTRLQESA